MTVQDRHTEGFLPRLPRRYVPPEPFWAGTMLGTGEAIKASMTKTREAGGDYAIVEMREDAQRYEEEIRYAREQIRRIKQNLDEYKLRLRQAQERIAEFEANAGEKQHVEDHEVEAVLKLVGNLKGLLGIRADEDGNVFVHVRTAIRVYGTLYDMGDYEFRIPADGFQQLGRHWEDIGKGLRINCLRLPAHPRALQRGDHRLHHHYGELGQRPNGQYYIAGGVFCVGGRTEEIRRALLDGEYRQAINLVVACLNETQHPQDVPVNGVEIPRRHEDAFYAGQ